MFDFAEKRLSEIPFVVVDTETTGLSAVRGDRVVEIGAVRYENGKPVAELEAIVNPMRPIPEKVSGIHGIYDADVVNAPNFAGILPQIQSLLEGALMVAHNAPFDANFLGTEYAIAHMPALFIDEKCRHSATLHNPWLCTLTLARKHFHFGQNHLANVAHLLGVRSRLAHRALSDVYTTADVLLRMAKQLEKQKLITVGDLLYAQGGAIFAPTLTNPTIPDPIFQSIANQTPVDVHYQSKQGETLRTISPKYVTIDRGTTYIIAHCHLRQEQRTFRLDRLRFV
jgi:DNA polymerase-3 subunit epsilon